MPSGDHSASQPDGRTVASPAPFGNTRRTLVPESSNRCPFGSQSTPDAMGDVGITVSVPGVSGSANQTRGGRGRYSSSHSHSGSRTHSARVYAIRLPLGSHESDWISSQGGKLKGSPGQPPAVIWV